MTVNSASLIFEEWKASLKSKDRTHKSVTTNFDELFYTLKEAGTPFEDAHEMLSKAIKAHQPSMSLAKNTYKHSKLYSNKVANIGESEFIAQWNQDIADKGTLSFFSVYPRPKTKEEEEAQKKVTPGGMTIGEYRMQKKISSQFTVLDTEELEGRMASGEVLSYEEIKKILGIE